MTAVEVSGQANPYSVSSQTVHLILHVHHLSIQPSRSVAVTCVYLAIVIVLHAYIVVGRNMSTVSTSVKWLCLCSYAVYIEVCTEQ